MLPRILAAFSFVLDLVIPPRKTALTVRALRAEDLQDLREDDGLPYHDERVRALVWEVKYYANRQALSLCGTLLAEVLLDVAQDTIGKPLLIPVPMHKARLKERGHNQTELLAQAALAHLDALEYAPRILERHTNTPQQQGLPERQRRTNVAKSMRATLPPELRGRVCVVLDDVTTTGATFAEAERALRQAGARHVVCVALAHS